MPTATGRSASAIAAEVEVNVVGVIVRSCTTAWSLLTSRPTSKVSGVIVWVPYPASWGSRTAI